MEKKEGIIKLWMNTEFTENYQEDERRSLS